MFGGFIWWLSNRSAEKLKRATNFDCNSPCSSAEKTRRVPAQGKISPYDDEFVMGGSMSDQRTTVESGDIAVGSPERRSGERYHSVWRLAKITRADDLGLWRVRNISNKGMMLAADVAVTLGEVLHIALSETVAMSGTIVWTREGRCGVAFDQPIDVAAVLKTLADEQQEYGYRQARLALDQSAEIYVDGSVFDIRVMNLSQSGVGFVYDGDLEIGKTLGLMLPDKVRRTAVVRWMRAGQGGLWLTEPLAHKQLESIRKFKLESC
jgi:hypothetical protein